MDYEISYDVSKFLDTSIEKVIHTLMKLYLGWVSCISFPRRLAVYNNPHCCASIVGWNFYFHAIL
jgi:hypothetical protein